MAIVSDSKHSNRSAKALALGIVILTLAFALVFWSEEDPVRRYRIYQDGPGSVVQLPGPNVIPANEGKLVLFNGDASIEKRLRDRQLGVSKNAIQLRRIVKMYQWQETLGKEEVTTPDGKTVVKDVYKYSKDWSERHYETLSFKKPIDHTTNEYRVNPSKMLFESKTLTPDVVKVGDFLLPPTIVERIRGFEKLILDESYLKPFPPDWRERVNIYEGGFYIGKGSAENPKVGDYLITYEYIKPGTLVTVLAQQEGATVTPYYSRYNGTLYTLLMGQQGLKDIFVGIEEGDPLIEWSVRVLAVILAIIGAKAFLSGIGVSASGIILGLALIPIPYAVIWAESEDILYALLGASGAFFVIFIIQLVLAMRKGKKSEGILAGAAIKFKKDKTTSEDIVPTVNEAVTGQEHSPQSAEELPTMIGETPAVAETETTELPTNDSAQPVAEASPEIASTDQEPISAVEEQSNIPQEPVTEQESSIEEPLSSQEPSLESSATEEIMQPADIEPVVDQEIETESVDIPVEPETIVQELSEDVQQETVTEEPVETAALSPELSLDNQNEDTALSDQEIGAPDVVQEEVLTSVTAEDDTVASPVQEQSQDIAAVDNVQEPSIINENSAPLDPIEGETIADTALISDEEVQENDIQTQQEEPPEQNQESLSELPTETLSEEAPDIGKPISNTYEETAVEAEKMPTIQEQQTDDVSQETTASTDNIIEAPENNAGQENDVNIDEDEEIIPDVADNPMVASPVLDTWEEMGDDVVEPLGQEESNLTEEAVSDTAPVSESVAEPLDTVEDTTNSQDQDIESKETSAESKVREMSIEFATDMGGDDQTEQPTTDSDDQEGSN